MSEPFCYCAPGDQLGPWPAHTHLSMPDPCPHVARLQLIAARFEGGEVLAEVLAHLDRCRVEVAC